MKQLPSAYLNSINKFLQPKQANPAKRDFTSICNLSVQPAQWAQSRRGGTGASQRANRLNGLNRFNRPLDIFFKLGPDGGQRHSGNGFILLPIAAADADATDTLVVDKYGKSAFHGRPGLRTGCQG